MFKKIQKFYIFKQIGSFSEMEIFAGLNFSKETRNPQSVVSGFPKL